MLRGSALVGLVALGVAGCSLFGGGRDEALDGPWVLASFGDAAGPVVDDAGTPPTMVLEAGEVTGHTGVNQFGGSYTWRGDGRIEFDDLMSTAIGGSEAQMAVERKFLDALGEVGHYEVADTRLRLSDADGGELLVFDPQTSGQPVRTGDGEDGT